MRTIFSIIALLCAYFGVASAFPNPFVSLAPSHLETRKNNNGTERGRNSVNRACTKISTLEKITRVASNQTHLDDLVAQGKLTPEKVEALKATAANATIELATMTSNATLVSECAVVNAHKRVQRQCKTMAKLAKLAKMANNQTAIDALAAKKSLDATQKQKLQDKIGNATVKLQAMQSNATLTNLCTNEKQKGSTQGNDQSQGSAQGNSQTPATASKSAASSTAAQSIPFIVGFAAVFAVLL